MNMEYKDSLAEVKELDDKGEGVLRFIRFHQEDKDSDITLPGFIQNQKTILIASHNWRSDHPPLGYGESFEADGATYFKFKLNMEDDRAKSWRSWLKMGGALQQVSYGFSPYVDAVERWQKDGRTGRYLKPRPDGSPGARLHEVSFCVVGSGNDQGVLSIKAAQEPIPPLSTPSLSHVEPAPSHPITPHQAATDDRVWNVWLQQSRVKATADRPEYYTALYAVADHMGAKARDQYRGLHHFVTEDGEPGPASLRACVELIFLLHKGVFPAQEREGIFTHVASHLRDAGIDPIHLLASDNYAVPLDTRVQVYSAGVDATVEELISIHDIRSAKGMTLTEARMQQVKDLWQRIDTFCQVLQLKAVDKPYSAQMEAFTQREYAKRLHERLEAQTAATQARQDEANRSMGEEFYQHFLAHERRSRGAERVL